VVLVSFLYDVISVPEVSPWLSEQITYDELTNCTKAAEWRSSDKLLRTVTRKWEAELTKQNTGLSRRIQGYFK
jgi:hypothetical protein